MGYWETDSTIPESASYFSNSTAPKTKPNLADKIIEENLNKTADERGTVKRSKLRNLYNSLRVAASLMFGGLTMSPGFTAGTNYTSKPDSEYTKNAKAPGQDDGKTLYLGGTTSNDNNKTPSNPGDNPLEYITVEGIVTGKPLENKPPTMVIAVYNGQNLDTANTDASGHYIFQNLPVGIGNHTTTSLEEILYPNPYVDKTNIDVYSGENTTKHLIVANAEGKIVAQKDIPMHIGAYRLTLNGGKPGIYTIGLFDKNEKSTFKAIKTGGDGPINVDINQIDESLLSLKSTSTTDSIKFVYSSPGFYTTDTTVAIETYLNINKDIWMIPLATHNLKIKPYDINGNSITDLTLDFKWADGTTTEHSVENDGLIHINRVEYTNPTATAIVTHNADTATYALYQFFRKTNHNLADTNYAQSPKPDSPTPPQPTPLNMTGIPDTLEIYMPHTQIPTPTPLIPTYGATIRYDHPDVKYIECSLSPGMSEKYIPVPSIGPTVIHWQPTWVEDTGNPVPPTDLQVAREERDNVRTVFQLNNGKTLFPPDTAVVITSTNDPMYLLLQARNFSQSARTQYRTGTPGNHADPTTNNSPNGGPIIDYSYSAYPAPNRNQIFSECTGQYFNFNDPQNILQNIAQWTRDQTTGLPTIFLLETGRTEYFANPGLKF